MNSNEVAVNELINLGAVDSMFFGKTFFPKTARQDSPPFHGEVWSILDGPDRYINIQVFRGGAKTSMLRMFTAKRIAYGLSRTILYIGKSEGHAVRSVRWIRRQVEFNHLYSQVFGLRPGAKWQDSECEIYHGVDEHPIWLLGVGITGSIRGVNFDDYRPDLIVVDDVVDEENSATPEQRQKVNALLYGAVKESLAPRSESPTAKLVALQTPLNKEDYSTLALKDPEWRSARFGCWTAATEALPLEQQESIWQSRYSSEELRNEKMAAIRRNQLSIFLREKECKIVSPETSAFRLEWLQYYDVVPEQMVIVMAIDPVPPPSDAQIAAGLKNKDFEVLSVVGRYKGDYYLLEYSMKRGHEPSWTIAEFFRLAEKWRPRKVRVEAVAYQRTLSWLIKQAMEQRRRYFVIDDKADNRKKLTRIVDGLSGIASEGHFHVRKEHSAFITQFGEYPDSSHDDLLDATATAVTELSESAYEMQDFEDILSEEEDIAPLLQIRGAP